MRKVLDLKIRQAECCLNCSHVLDESFHGGGGVDEQLYCKLLMKAGLPKNSMRGEDAVVHGEEVCDEFKR